MADNEIQKRTGTIFIGSRETSPEKLHAMQEPLRREQIRREQADDYLSRVRKKAEDRAREILGAAYMEKQNVLEEAKKESLELKKRAIEEAERLRGEGEQARREGRDELDKAAAIREEAENIRANAHDEGYQAGMEQAKAELEELRSEMGQSLALVLNALGRQRKEIMEAWSGDIAEVVRCAVRAGTGMILREDREEALRALVFRSLDALERQEIVNLRVNPEDEEAVGQMFQAAREKYPSLKQWVVSPDGSVERGGLIAESGSGRVDLRRANFEEMVDNVLNHLYLPEDETKNQSEIRDLVEMEVAKIAGLTPEPEPVASPETEAVDTAASEE
ncbi:MAG: flagellar assembly protein FliH, partial [Desulfovibrio sp.]|nr:flagellar assembly protein FliH [Desulfovibrio sp.]